MPGCQAIGSTNVTNWIRGGAKSSAQRRSSFAEVLEKKGESPYRTVFGKK